jgi:hypothetical protein
MNETTGFLSFACHAMACVSRVPARHHQLLIERLQEVADGGCDRLHGADAAGVDEVNLCFDFISGVFS